MKKGIFMKVLKGVCALSVATCGVVSFIAMTELQAYATPEEEDVFEGQETQSVTSEPIEFIIPDSLTVDEETDVEDVLEARGHADGERRVRMLGSTLIPQCLPDAYYGEIDISSDWPFESMHQHWTAGSDSAIFMSQPDVYVDDLGFVRKPAPEDQFHLYGDNNDDYVVALGSFYKTKHTCGERWLVITTTGTFTITTGDEQADDDTEPHNMFIWGENGKAHFLEFMSDPKRLPSDVRISGSVTSAPIDAFKGEIISMLRIA